ncbi:Cullin-5, partial [Stegodyphus mimosarum]
MSSVDFVKIKILNTGAWARASERIPVSLPLELEDFIPEVEEFYKQKYSGRKLQWYHHMSNGTVRIYFFSLLFVFMYNAVHIHLNSLQYCCYQKI